MSNVFRVVKYIGIIYYASESIKTNIKHVINISSVGN